MSGASNTAKNAVIVGAVVAVGYVAYKTFKPFYDIITSVAGALAGAVGLVGHAAEVESHGPALLAQGLKNFVSHGCSFKPNPVWLDMSKKGGDIALGQGYFDNKGVGWNLQRCLATWCVAAFEAYPEATDFKQYQMVYADVNGRSADPGMKAAFSKAKSKTGSSNAGAQAIYAATAKMFSCAKLPGATQQSMRNIASSLIFNEWPRLMGDHIVLKPL
jgi:hypothetical protein